MATGQAANIWDALPPADADRIHESSVGRLTLGELADMVMCSVKVLDLSVPFDFRHRAVVKWTLQHCPDWCPPRLPALHKPPRRRQPSAPEPPPKRARGDDDAAGAVRAAVVKTEPGEGPAPAPDAAVPALGDFVAFGEQGRPPGAAPAAASATPAPASDTPAPMGDFIAFQAPDPQPEPSPAAAAPVAAAPAPAADGAEPEHQFAAQFAAAHHFSDAFVAPGHGFAGGPPGPPHPVPGPGFPPSDAAPFAAPPHFTPAGPPPPYRAPSDPWAQAPQAPAPAPPSAPTDAQAKAAARRSKLAASIFSSSNATGLRPPVEAPRAPQAFGRKLSYLLRHGAQREGLSMRSDGFVPLVELLQRPDFRGVGIEDIEALVAADAKHRYTLRVEDGIYYIAAHQGHSISVPDLPLQQILNPAQAPVCIHGTFYRFWGEIRRTGLSPMARQHIHFATHPPDHLGMIAGMRAHAEVLIHLDVPRCLADGMPLFLTGNAVILTTGFQGIVPPDYFLYVEDAKTHHRLWPPQ